MKKIAPYITAILLICTTLPFASCNDGEELINTYEGNFNALWKIMDEHYCFFDYKQVDWNEVYQRYHKRLGPNLDSEALFRLMNEMLAELKDGHVNLYSPFDVGRYWKWFEDYPTNYDANLMYDSYLQKDFSIVGNIRFKILDDNIGYLYYGSFANSVGEGALDQILSQLQICDGIIFDVRSNGGGNLTNVETIASRFTNKRIHIGYIQHKTGKGHQEFSTPHPRYLNPSPRIRWQKNVAVIANRSSFSSTNDFVAVMKLLPKVQIFGDKTGGGSGLPFSSELPNGWSVRFSASPMLDPNMEHTEFGVDPHHHINMNPDDTAKGLDTIIEAARKHLRENK